jgi:hypothetical protein
MITFLCFERLHLSSHYNPAVPISLARYRSFWGGAFLPGAQPSMGISYGPGTCPYKGYLLAFLCKLFLALFLVLRLCH